MKKFYITTSLAYTNAPAHLGFALESVQADVIARHQRLRGKAVYFLTGTDEHGAKVAKAAAQAKKEAQEFVAEISENFRALKQLLNLSNNDFIRTTDQNRHWPAVKKAWLKFSEKGDIYKKKYRGFYCSGCEAFITKKDLNKEEKCQIHQIQPEIIEEENYFFRLSRYQKEIKKAIEKNKIKITPQSRKNEILKFINQGLEDISCSRPRKDLRWGIPVPQDHSHTVYVWLEALLNYVSAIGYAENSDKFKKFWPAEVHCIGKDILKFHAVIFPGMILSLGLPLPRSIFVHGFITVGGQKMSKSLGNVIDPFELVGKYGTDAVRYYLLREILPTEDGDFTNEKFEERYNADLAKGLGNLVARVLTLVDKHTITKGKVSSDVKSEIDKTKEACQKSLEEFKFNEALASIWQLISFCDRYIERTRPWEKKSPEVIYNLLFALANIAEQLQPFLPETSEKILEQLKKGKKGTSLFPSLK